MSSVRRRKEVSAGKNEPKYDELDEQKEPPQFGRPKWLLIVLFIVFLVASSVHLHKCLPTPLPPNEANDRFSEVRALPILRKLSDFGPKPAGSEACEKHTRNAILQELVTLKEATSASVNFQIETQNPSGCFSLPKFDTDGFSICYRNVSNVIARLGKNDATERVAVLLNCHYDSWPTSSGGSDDLISCALMLELIRLYSHQPQKLEHDIIFLFNGAEESSLLAAHGFITQHRWRHSIRAFINLEASGSGGRELLFQAGPSNQWLLNSYLQAAVHPHCSVIGQEVFQSGVYPGDTDFRIFRDYGRVPGLDLAFVQNGYWWHTEFDEAKRITPGSLQRAGDNVYSTLSHLLASPYLDSPAEFGDVRYVFFDFLGLFVVVYSLALANIIDIALIVLTVVIFVRGISKQQRIYASAIVHYFATLASMVGAVVFVPKVVNFVIGSSSWYSFHFVAPIIYGIPIAWTGVAVLTFVTNNIPRRERKSHAEALEDVHSLLLASITAFFVYKGIASGFLFSLLLIPVVKRLIPSLNHDSWRSLFVHLLLVAPGLSMAVYSSELLLSVFIPIMGRTSGNPEPIVAAFIAFSAINIVLAFVGPITLSGPTRSSTETGIKDLLFVFGGLLFTIVLLFYVVSSFVGAPFRYDDAYPTTKRTQFYHVNRLFYNADNSLKLNESGLYAISHDYRGAEDIPFVRKDNGFDEIKCEYEDAYCEIPFYYPTRDRIKSWHIRYKTEPDFVNFTKPTTVKMLKKTAINVNTLRYELQVEGSAQISVYAIAESGFKVVRTSLTDDELDAQHYFLYLTCSGDCATWNFSVDVQKSQSTSSSAHPLLLGVSSHYLFGNDMQSDTLKRLLSIIKERREDEHSWAITASAWNVDMIYRYF